MKMSRPKLRQRLQNLKRIKIKMVTYLSHLLRAWFMIQNRMPNLTSKQKENFSLQQQLMKPLRKTQTNMVRKIFSQTISMSRTWRTVQLLLQWNCMVILETNQTGRPMQGIKQRLNGDRFFQNVDKVLQQLIPTFKIHTTTVKRFRRLFTNILQILLRNLKILVEKFGWESLVTQLWESLLLLTLVMLKKGLQFSLKMNLPSMMKMTNQLISTMPFFQLHL